MGCLCSKKPKRIKETSTSEEIEEFLSSPKVRKYKWKFENLVIEGSASNGTVSIGAYRIMERLGVLDKIKRYVGSSSGSMMAAFAAVKIPAADLEHEFMQLDLNKFKDDSFGIFDDLSRLLNRYGFYKGDFLEQWVEKTLYKYTGIQNITFEQVFERYESELYITRVNLSILKTEYLSRYTHEDMPISQAVRHSTSIPFVFKIPDHVDVMVDGGVGDSYPIDLFDGIKYNKKTLGLKIMSPNLERRSAEIRHSLGFTITNLIDFIEAFITFQTVALERTKVKEGYWERTISLRSPDRPMHDFDVTVSEKATDIHTGMTDAVIAFSKWIESGHF